MKFLIKYISLVILFLTLIYQTRMYADFTASNSNIIILPTLIILIFLNIILLYSYDFKKERQSKTTSLTLSFLIILLVINLLFNYKQSKKEIVSELYVSNNILLKQIGYEIKLYKDKTFEINEYWHGESIHYFGKYILENNLLTFIDENIEEKTEYQITRKYRLNTEMQRFEALEKGFQNLNPR